MQSAYPWIGSSSFLRNLDWLINRTYWQDGSFYGMPTNEPSGPRDKASGAFLGDLEEIPHWNIRSAGFSRSPSL